MEKQNELQHWGIKGMKWGVRRYQNKNGTLTSEGKKRYSDSNVDKENNKTDTRAKSTSSSTTQQDPHAHRLKGRINNIDSDMFDEIEEYETSSGKSLDYETEQKLAAKCGQKILDDVYKTYSDAAEREKYVKDLSRTMDGGLMDDPHILAIDRNTGKIKSYESSTMRKVYENSRDADMLDAYYGYEKGTVDYYEWGEKKPRSNVEYSLEYSESSDELQHHGTKGMRWGFRRYQNKDGSLTPAGKKRRLSERTDKKVKSIEDKTADKIKKLKETAKYQKKIDKAEAKAQAKLAKAEEKYGVKKKTGEDESKPKQKSINEMTNDELREQITRIQLQQQLSALTPKQQSKGEKFVNSMLNDVIIPAAKTAGKDLATDYMKKIGKDVLGLNEKEAKDSMAMLKKEAEKAGYQKTISDAKKAAAEAKKATLEADGKEIDHTKKLKREAEEVKKAKQAEKESKQAEKQAGKESKQAEKQAEREAKQAEKESKQAEKQAGKESKQAEKQAEREAKQAEKEAKQAEREAKRSESKTESSSKKTDDGPYEGTVEGEGTSRFSGWSSGPTVDATYREYSDKSSTSSEITSLSVPGRSYALSMYDMSIAGLLERKY